MICISPEDLLIALTLTIAGGVPAYLLGYHWPSVCRWWLAMKGEMPE